QDSAPNYRKPPDSIRSGSGMTWLFGADFGNLTPIAARTPASLFPASPLVAAKPRRSGTVSRSQTMTLVFISGALHKLRASSGPQSIASASASRRHVGAGALGGNGPATNSPQCKKIGSHTAFGSSLRSGFHFPLPPRKCVEALATMQSHPFPVGSLDPNPLTQP